MPLLTLNPRQVMITTLHSEEDDVAKLVDGIVGLAADLNYQPLNANSTLAWPAIVLVDLESTYTLERISYHDGGGAPLIRLHAGPDKYSLTQIAEIRLDQYDVIRETVSTMTGVQFIAIELVEPLTRFPSEFKFYATRTGAAFVEPTAVINDPTTIRQSTGNDAHSGNDYVKYIPTGPLTRHYYDFAYWTKQVGAGPAYTIRTNEHYSGGYSIAKFQAIKALGGRNHICMQFCPETIRNRNDYTTGFGGANSTTSAGAGFLPQGSSVYGIDTNYGYCVNALTTGANITNTVLSVKNKKDQYQTVQLDIKLNNALDVVRLIGRYIDADNYIFLEIRGDNTTRLGKREATIETWLADQNNNSSAKTNAQVGKDGLDFVGREVTFNLSFAGSLEYFVDKNGYGGYYANTIFNVSTAVKFGFAVLSGAGTGGSSARFQVATHDKRFKFRQWDSDPLNKESWRAYGEFAHHFGHIMGAGIKPASTIPYDLAPFNGTQVQPIEANLNLVESVELGNELNKHWEGDEGYWSPDEHACMVAVATDGFGNTMGPNVGIKNADPNMKVYSAGLIGINHFYHKLMVYFWKKYLPGGYCPIDTWNYHHYNNNGGGQFTGTAGTIPEHSDNKMYARMVAAVDWSSRYTPGKGNSLTEFGYDTNMSIQKAVDRTPTYSIEDSQGIDIIRTISISKKAGFTSMLNFTANDEPGVTDASTRLYEKSGLLTGEKYNTNGTPAVDSQLLKDSYFWVWQFVEATADFVFFADESSVGITKHVYKKPDGTLLKWVWSPTGTNIILAAQSIAPPTGALTAKKITLNKRAVRTETNIPTTAAVTSDIGEAMTGFLYTIDAGITPPPPTQLVPQLSIPAIVGVVKLKAALTQQMIDVRRRSKKGYLFAADLAQALADIVASMPTGGGGVEIENTTHIALLRDDGNWTPGYGPTYTGLSITGYNEHDYLFAQSTGTVLPTYTTYKYEYLKQNGTLRWVRLVSQFDGSPGTVTPTLGIGSMVIGSTFIIS